MDRDRMLCEGNYVVAKDYDLFFKGFSGNTATLNKEYTMRVGLATIGERQTIFMGTLTSYEVKSLMQKLFSNAANMANYIAQHHEVSDVIDVLISVNDYIDISLLTLERVDGDYAVTLPLKQDRYMRYVDMAIQEGEGNWVKSPNASYNTAYRPVFEDTFIGYSKPRERKEVEMYIETLGRFPKRLNIMKCKVLESELQNILSAGTLKNIRNCIYNDFRLKYGNVKISITSEAKTVELMLVHVTCEGAELEHYSDAQINDFIESTFKSRKGSTLLADIMSKFAGK